MFTPDFSLALAITIVVAAGTYLMAPPFSWVMSLNDHFKDTGAKKYGEPPYGHAELSSLKTFADKMALDLEKSMKLLDKAGYTVADSSVRWIVRELKKQAINVSQELMLKTIADQNSLGPIDLYERIKDIINGKGKVL